MSGGWTLETLKTYLEDRLLALGARSEAAMSAADLRYQQRHDADGVALNAALSADRDAVQAASNAADKSVAAALAAAERAVNKAEAATEKRFDNVNEFRQSLNDMTRNMIPRMEAESSIKAGADRSEALVKALGERLDTRSNALEDRITSSTTSLDVKFSTLIETISTQVRNNTTRITAIESQKTGASGNQSTVISFAALALTLILGAISIYSANSHGAAGNGGVTVQQPNAQTAIGVNPATR